MGTVVVTHNRNHHQYSARNRRCGSNSTKFRSFGSSRAANFWATKCRTFQSKEVLLPTVAKNLFLASHSPDSRLPYVGESQGISKDEVKMKLNNKERDLHFSERWAGPAYSNSPCPSSLPIPKFSMRPRRTLSLEFPRISSEISLDPVAKSAPASPTRKWRTCPDDLSKGNHFEVADSATKNLRRILNLDIDLN